MSSHLYFITNIYLRGNKSTLFCMSKLAPLSINMRRMSTLSAHIKAVVPVFYEKYIWLSADEINVEDKKADDNKIAPPHKWITKSHIKN